MHLLQAQPGAIADGSSAVDLAQTPGEIIFLSAADTELACLATARRALGDSFPSLRLANLMQLSHNASVDLYCDEVIAHAKLVVVRILGGISYWPYGIEQLCEICRHNSIGLVLLPGDDQPDVELASASTVPSDVYHRLWQYLVHGGAENSVQFLSFAATLISYSLPWQEPVALPRAGVYWPDEAYSYLHQLKRHWKTRQPVAAIVFYRALILASNLAPIDALISALAKNRINALPIFCASLKESVSASVVETLIADGDVAVVLNTTGFSVSTPGQVAVHSPLNATKAPVFQVVLSGGNLLDWSRNTHGLSAREIAMNIALPEVDGRVLTRAISFKGEESRDDETECPLISYQPVPDRVDFVVALVAKWIALGTTPISERRVAIVLANYPNRDGRLGNGVGLDTPASVVGFAQAMRGEGYNVEGFPFDGDELIRQIQQGPTNSGVADRDIRHHLSLDIYDQHFQLLPEAVRHSVTKRWGSPCSDPFFVAGCDCFAIPAIVFGHVVVGLQPARGYNIDPKSTYHDPDLVPPHGYFAFYIWLRIVFGVHAIIHMGKHGNMEWLPGKALALSSECFPEAVFGAIPHFYPFIVNDPGEGTQAKRRSQAVIVDHLTPPLTRAETYGELAELELLIDEFFEASGVDPRRLEVLGKDILELAVHIGLDRDCGIDVKDTEETALAKLDNYLCELKELQIRGGLHEFGVAPIGEERDDLLVALTRLPRGENNASEQSLIRALAKDLELGDFDPLDCDLGKIWEGPKPSVLMINNTWRSTGDTVERLELFAKRLVSGKSLVNEDWENTSAVMSYITEDLGPTVDICGSEEHNGLLRSLDGYFLPPGPSGAPTRGRNDVLPTGRNFFSVDTRTVPTPAAWHLGWKSAGLVLDRYSQEHGCWPTSLALSAWGTSNMRTGGDDIAQALALMGVRPTWEVASRRVTGFEVLPLDVLDRPRVDVTLRVSGFFRDAFPAQIDLFDSAVRAVASLEESGDLNPIAMRCREEADALIQQGTSPLEATRLAGYRVFGSKPGAYGAGLQALIDEGGWDNESDFARAYLAWGGYAYGNGEYGAPAAELLTTRLSKVQVVLHNQDNREHDILDSDDYYQFEGGLGATVKYLTGASPTIYHNDHSRPDRPRVASLKEEIGRVVRGRVVNPKWIGAMKMHGYKGAFELTATVDYLFAFAATTGMVENHHFEAVYDAFVEKDDVREFMETANPHALKELCNRLLEAYERDFWRPRSNSAVGTLRHLAS